MNWTLIKDLTPWILGLITTIIALKKDWLLATFESKKNKLHLNSSYEDIEGKQLSNVEKQIDIYRGLLDDLQIRHKEIQASFENAIDRLKMELLEANDLIEEQKKFIAKQFRSLKYYQDKCQCINPKEID